MAIVPLYLTRVAGLTPAEVAIGMGVGALAGVIGGIPAGILADRRGAKGVVIFCIVGMGVVALLYQFINSAWVYFVLAAIDGALDRGVAAVSAAVVAGAVSGANRVSARAALRVALNVGLTLGGALSAIALGINNEVAFRVVLLLDAITYFAAALCYLGLRLNKVTAAEDPTSSLKRLSVMRDWRYVRVTTLLSVLHFSTAVLSVAMPLWVADRTNAPQFVIAVLIAINTIGLFLLQTPVGRRIRVVPVALRATTWAGVMLMMACIAFASAALVTTAWAAIVLLVVAILFFLGGELLSSTSQFVLSYDLADDMAQGQYQGVFHTILGVTMSVAPILVISMTLGWGPWGWVSLGVIFLFAGLLMRPAATTSKVSLIE